MKISKNTKKAGLALIGSLTGFMIARHMKIENNYPYILLGGFVGNTLGEELIPEECRPANALGYIDREGKLKMIEL